MKVRFLDPAKVEMQKAARQYENEADGLGSRFLSEVQERIDLVQEQPFIGVEVGRLRRVLLHKFPFSLIYIPDQEEILIVAVAHQRRLPGYWKDRK